MVEVIIVGCGDGGHGNLESMMAMGVKIVAVCDSSEEVLNAVKHDMGEAISVYHSIQEALFREDADVVVVATPDGQHLAPAKAALEAGRRVFIEKPVAAALDDLCGFDDLIKTHAHRMLFSEKYSFAHPVQAALAHRAELGKFLCGTTSYMMWKCDRIMGGGKWRTECAYNPCAGGLSHNFMTSLLFAGSPIVRVRATGQVLTYRENLDRFGGYDTMEGTLEFYSGQRLNWLVCLAVRGADSPFGHRTVAHVFQFEHGALVYGPTPQSDQLIVDGRRVWFMPEPDAENWSDYNIGVLYRKMHGDLFAAVATGTSPLHDISQGINVAYACCLAFESAKRNGAWMRVLSA